MFNDLRFLLRSLFRRRPSRAPQSAAEAAALDAALQPGPRLERIPDPALSAECGEFQNAAG